MRILGIDMGKVRIGTALSDPGAVIASPARVIQSGGHKRNATAVAEFATEVGADAIVVGMPINLDGTRGQASQSVGRFIEELRKIVKIEVIPWDERLTSSQANKIMISADVSRGGRKAAVDNMAAAIMLQSYLERRRSEGAID